MIKAKKLKIVFAGTPSFGLPALEAISKTDHILVGVFTQPDKKAGRGLHLQHSPIKDWALANNFPVFQPEHFKTEASIALLADLKPDLMVVIAYGLILPQRVLSIPSQGCINVHASLLPRWRGASPIQQAIIAGDEQSGVTIMQMDAGLDTGNALMTVSCPLLPRETAGSLHDKLSKLAESPLLAVIEGLAKNSIESAPQNPALATYAKKIKKEDALIDWTKEAYLLERQIRAYNPWPIAYSHANDILMRIYDASIEERKADALPGSVLAIDKEGILVAAGVDALRIKRIQFAGGKILSVSDWVNSGRAASLLNTVLL